MKYRLKDRELQKKLDELFGHQRFSEELNAECKRTGCKGNITMFLSFDPAVNASRDRCSYVGFLFMREDIERFVEYNPKTWNNYPEVEPPEGVLMRVERSDGYKTCAYFKHFEDGSDWMHTNNLCMPKAMSDLIVRFRPWDDEEEA